MMAEGRDVEARSKETNVNVVKLEIEPHRQQLFPFQMFYYDIYILVCCSYLLHAGGGGGGRSYSEPGGSKE
jgi:hypothetical protein